MNRIGFIGASDVPVIVGLSPYKTPRQLWEEKTGQSPPWAGSLRTDVGTALEELVITRAACRLGGANLLRTLEFTHPSEPWLVAHVDGTCEVDGETVILEGKTCGFPKRDAGWGKAGTENVPPHYWLQCQMMMLVTGIKRTHLANLLLSRLAEDQTNPQLHPIEFDEASALKALARAKEFWKFVETKTWPYAEAA